MILRSILFTGAINSLFFILLLQTKRNRSSAHDLLSIFMALIALQLSFYYVSLSHLSGFPVPLGLALFSVPLLSSAVLYHYIKAIGLNNAMDIRKKWPVTLPYLCFNLLAALLYCANPSTVYIEDAYPHFSDSANVLFPLFLLGMMAVVPAYYSLKALGLLIKFERALPDRYSFTERISLNWLKWIVISTLLLFAGLFLLIRFGVTWGLLGYPDLFAWVGTVLTIYVFFIGFFGLRQYTPIRKKSPLLGTAAEGLAIVENIQADEVDMIRQNYRNSGLTEQRLSEIFLDLKEHMQTHQPYLNDELSLDLLADQLQVSANHLSQVINQQAGVNFFSFINRYRVEEVKVKLHAPEYAHYSILGIAYDCGFRSKSSFNKIFKDMVGVTPLQFQKNK